MTPGQVARHAAARPGAIAVVDRGREISYADFDRDIRRFIGAVRELGLKRGSIVAVGCDDRYLHWLLLLACEHLALVTASFRSAETDAAALLARADFIFADPDYPVPKEKRHFIVSADWRREAFSRAAAGGEGDTLLTADDPVRIIRTSGTTGIPKQLLLTSGAHERRIAIYAAHARLDARSRFLLTMPFTVGAAYHHAKACLHAGGTVVVLGAEGPYDLGPAIVANAITHLIQFPLHLKQMLDRLPRDFPKPPDLTVTSFGAATPPVLRRQLLARLATAVFDYYGSNESGFIAFVPPEGDGEFREIFPGVHVEIVDDDHRPLPEGRIGRVRVKTDCMVERYWEDDATTRAMFRDGWFYPGDLAALHPGRRLQLIGRGDDLLNIGGTKVAPEALEAWLARHLPAKDIGVCAVKNADGIEEVCVALVEPGVAGEEILKRIDFAFRTFQVGSYRVALLGAIPRTATGKIERDRLRGIIAAGERAD